ncbi:MAG: MMPL family transporter, partial [Desulfobacterales bacterium]|nr:MMPL family transporter [Desulfobacterales bacterium]
MANIRQNIEHGFATLAGRIYDRPWLFIAVIALLAAGLASQIPGLRMDTSNESFLHKNDPILGVYEEFKDQFGLDELIIVAIEPPEVFDLAFLKKLQVLHDDLADNVPRLADITSLVNARDTRGEEDRLIVGDLLETHPRDDSELAALKERVMSNPLYRNRLISPDGRMTTIVLEPEAAGEAAGDEDALDGFDEETEAAAPATPDEPAMTKDDIAAEAVASVREIVEKHQGDDFRIHLAGSPVVTKALKMSMISDTARFIKLAVLAIGICLYLMFRRISGVFLTLLVVMLALLSTLGLMALFRVSFDVPHTILPSLLLAVGVGAVVHVLALVYHHLDINGD